MEELKNKMLGLFWAVVICLILSQCLSSCRTKYVAVPEIHTEYKHSTDSFFQRDTIIQSSQTIVREVDSLTLAQFGITLEKQKKAYLVRIDNLEKQLGQINAIKHDTICKTDSISIPYEVVKYKQSVAGWGVSVLLLVVLLVVVYLFGRKR